MVLIIEYAGDMDYYGLGLTAKQHKKWKILRVMRDYRSIEIWLMSFYTYLSTLCLHCYV